MEEMITRLPSSELLRLTQLPTKLALREMERQLDRLAHPTQGNATVIPFRTRTRRTVQDWPMPPSGGAA